MDAYRLNVKLYFGPEAEIDQESLIPVFHRWIQDHELDELLIDVADYKHVPQGPGVMLIAHDANYGLDSSDGELGLLYARKRPAAGDFGSRLRDAFGKALAAAAALRGEGVGLEAAGDRWSFRINDRLLAPNTEETLKDVEPELTALLDDLYGTAAYDLHRSGDAEGWFGVTVTAAEKPGLAALRQRFEAARLAVAV